ncbi:hypothetical protein A2U01_0059037, partial [Trifolium medium]|nr:hypothetical protein [Trifolium medium]
MAAQRTNAHIAQTLAAMARMMVHNVVDRVAQTTRMGGEEELILERFMKNNPPIFTGGYDPKGAQKWIEGVEIIFDAMRCSEEQNVVLGTYVLHEEAGYWWKNTYQ